MTTAVKRRARGLGPSAYWATRRPVFWARLGDPLTSSVVTGTRVGPGGVGTRGFGSTLGVATSDRVVTPLTSSSIVRSFVVRYFRQGTGFASRLFDKRDSGSQVEVLFDSSGLIYERQWSGSLARWALGPFPTGEGATLAFAYDASSTANNPVVYANGVPRTVSRVTAPVGTLTNNTEPYVIGNRGAGDRGFDGWISDFIVFDSLLSADELRAISQDVDVFYRPRRILVPVSVAGGGLTLTADTGSFTLTGNDTGLKTSRLLGADSGSFALTGNDADLVYTPAGAFTLTADTGSFALTGNAANLLRSLKLTADTVSFALTGNDTNLVYSPAGAYTLTADTGTFTLTGNDAGVLRNRSLVADTGSFNLTGIDAGLARVRRLIADSVAFVLTGHDAALSTDGTVEATTRGGAGKAKLKKKKRRQLEATQDPAIIKVIHNLESEKVVDGRVVHETKQVIEPVVVKQETVESLAPVIETLKELVPPVVEAKDSITIQLEALTELVKAQNEEIQKLRKSVENLEEVVIVMLNT